MDTLARFMESDQLRVVVDRTYPLSQAPPAMRQLMSGQPVGRIVLRINGYEVVHLTSPRSRVSALRALRR